LIACMAGNGLREKQVRGPPRRLWNRFQSRDAFGTI